MSNAVASHVAMEQKFTGASFTTSTACSSSNHAIGQAFWLIRQGTLDCALAGGSEAPIVPGHLKAWEGMRVVAPDTCRPFSKNRAGLILGEGAAMLVLETLEQARARGAKIYAELAGFGMSADAHHLTNPLPEGAARAMNDALYDAGLSREQINYINAHGTATLFNDAAEGKAIAELFGTIPVSSTKSMIGHSLGAAGAIEAAVCLLALQAQLLPPNINFRNSDQDLELNIVANESRQTRIDIVLSNSFGFGGTNASILIQKLAG